MHELTAHDLQQQEQANRQARAASRRVEEQDLRRLVPVNHYLDHAHLADLMRQGPAGNRPFLLWRHFAAVGMRAEGYTADVIAAALELPPPKLDAVLAPVTPWQVPDDVRRRFPMLYPELVKHDAAFAPHPSHIREDYPFVGTSGWRQSGPLDPGTRTRTLGGAKPAGQQ